MISFCDTGREALVGRTKYADVKKDWIMESRIPKNLNPPTPDEGQSCVCQKDMGSTYSRLKFQYHCALVGPYFWHPVYYTGQFAISVTQIQILVREQHLQRKQELKRDAGNAIIMNRAKQLQTIGVTLLWQLGMTARKLWQQGDTC